VQAIDDREALGLRVFKGRHASEDYVQWSICVNPLVTHDFEDVREIW
jgi:hypothetical protein